MDGGDAPPVSLGEIHVLQLPVGKAAFPQLLLNALHLLGLIGVDNHADIPRLIPQLLNAQLGPLGNETVDVLPSDVHLQQLHRRTQTEGGRTGSLVHARDETPVPLRHLVYLHGVPEIRLEGDGVAPDIDASPNHGKGQPVDGLVPVSCQHQGLPADGLDAEQVADGQILTFIHKHIVSQLLLLRQRPFTECPGHPQLGIVVPPQLLPVKLLLQPRDCGPVHLAELLPQGSQQARPVNHLVNVLLPGHQVGPDEGGSLTEHIIDIKLLLGIRLPEEVPQGLGILVLQVDLIVYALAGKNVLHNGHKETVRRPDTLL